MVEASLFREECQFADLQCLHIPGLTGPSNFRFDWMPVFLDDFSLMHLNHGQEHTLGQAGSVAESRLAR